MDQMERNPEKLVDGNPLLHLTMDGNSELVTENIKIKLENDNTSDRNVASVISHKDHISTVQTVSDNFQYTTTESGCEKSSSVETSLASSVGLQNEKSSCDNPSILESNIFTDDHLINKSKLLTDSKKSRTDAQSDLFDMSDIQNINHGAFIRNSTSLEPEDSYFGSESSMFKLSDSGNIIAHVHSENQNLQFVDSVLVADELAEVGMNESSSQMVFDTDKRVQDGFDQTDSYVPVRPGSLKKSNTIMKTVSSKAKNAPHGMITTLVDLSSIIKLKNLWEKSPKSFKKLTGSPMKCKVKSSEEEIKCSKAQDCDNILKAAVKHINPNVKNKIKSCSVKLIKVESMASQIKDLVIDLSVPSSVHLPNQRMESNAIKSKTQTNFLDNSSFLIINKSNRKLKFPLSKSKDKIDMEPENDIAFANHSCNDILAVTNSLVNSGFENETKNVSLNGQVLSECKSMEDVQKAVVPLTQSNEFPKADINIAEDSEDDFLPSDDYNEDDVDFKPSLHKSRKIKVVRKKNVLRFLKKSGGKTKKNKETGNNIVSTDKFGKPSDLGPFCCNVCDFKADKRTLLTKHSKCHGHSEMFSCRFCEKRCRTNDGIIQHEAKVHTNERPFKCDHEGCNYASNDKRDLCAHKNKHSVEKSFFCDICDFKTRYPKNLRIHKKFTHSDVRRFKCTVCSFMTKRHIDLKQHMYRHSDDKPIECIICRFRVKTNWELQSHMLKHSDEKPFKCPHPGCKQGTKTKADLAKHIVKHQEERPFVCDLCKGAYKTQSSLNKHHTLVHNATRNFQCDNCVMKFKTKQSLQKHLQVHSGYKPYSCEVCGHKFANRNNMSKHMVTHNVTVRPYRCPLCPYAAKEQGHLLTHIGTFHGNTYAYFCELCKKPFQRYSRLQIHYERMHKGDMDKIVNEPPMDLALLKLEMKQNLEEAEWEMMKEMNSSDIGERQDLKIKKETVDDDDCFYEAVKSNQNKSEELAEMNLNEENEKVEVVKSSNNDQECKEAMNIKVVGENLIKQNFDSKGSEELLNKTIDKHVFGVEQMANAEIKSNDINKDMEIKVEEKYGEVHNCLNSSETFTIGKNACATIAMYNDFRLPLATKGFQFNYEKSGKKPNTWFMDWKLMSGKEAEKQKKYLRRVGKMKPLLRGNHKMHDKSLTGFVTRRKRKLEENIRKAKFMKDNGLITKRTHERKSRFKGNYMEFETLEGEELNVCQVLERIPRVGYPSKESKVKSKWAKASKSKIQSQKDGARKYNNQAHKGFACKSEMNTQKIKVSKHTDKAGTEGNKNNRKNRPISKNQARESPSEKLATFKQTNKNMTVRKPLFLQNDIRIELHTNDATVDANADRNSFKVLETILTEFSECVSGSSDTAKGISPCSQKYESTNKPKIPAKRANKKCTLKRKMKDTISSKQKYDRKYIPVKQAKKRKMVSPKMGNTLATKQTTEDTSNGKTSEKVAKKAKQKALSKRKLKIKIPGKPTKWPSNILDIQQNNGTVSCVHMSNSQVGTVYPANVFMETNPKFDVNVPEIRDVIRPPSESNMESLQYMYITVNTGESDDGTTDICLSENEYKVVLAESTSDEIIADESSSATDGVQKDFNVSASSEESLMLENVVIKQEPPVLLDS